jgi:hypothetical protein
MYYWKEFGFLLFLVAMWPEVALDRVGRLEAVVLGSSLVGAIGPSRVVAQPEIKYQTGLTGGPADLSRMQMV